MRDPKLSLADLRRLALASYWILEGCRGRVVSHRECKEEATFDPPIAHVVFVHGPFTVTVCADWTWFAGITGGDTFAVEGVIPMPASRSLHARDVRNAVFQYTPVGK